MLTLIWLAMLPVAVLLEVAALIAMMRDRGAREARDFRSGLRSGSLRPELQAGAEWDE